MGLSRRQELCLLGKYLSICRWSWSLAIEQRESYLSPESRVENDQGSGGSKAATSNFFSDEATTTSNKTFKSHKDPSSYYYIEQKEATPRRRHCEIFEESESVVRGLVDQEKKFIPNETKNR